MWIRESLERAKSRPEVAPEPGVMLVIPRALRVPRYSVGSALDVCAGVVTFLMVGSFRVERRLVSRYLRSHRRRILERIFNKTLFH